MNLHLIRHARRVVGFITVALFVLLLGFSLVMNLTPLTGRQLFVIIGGVVVIVRAAWVVVRAAKCGTPDPELRGGDDRY